MPNVRLASTLTQVALEHIGTAAERGDLPEELTDGLRAQYLGRLYRLQTSTDDEDLEAEGVAAAEAELAMRRDLIDPATPDAGRSPRPGRIGVTTLRTIEHDLDLEEARLSSP